MPAITAVLNALELPRIEVEFVHTSGENAVDIETLDGSLYTDFVSQEYTWMFNYDSLTEAQYNAIKAIYDSQFTLYEYPTLTIDYYSVDEVPVRMSINPKSIIDNCGTVQGVQLIFRVTAQLPEVS